MVSYLAKGVTVWILGFLTFVAGLNAMNAVVQWAVEGREWVFKPYLIGDFIGEMQVTTYLWASITITFLFLGLTAIIAYSRPPPDPAILGKIVGVEEELATNRSMLESTQIGLYQRLENNERAREELFSKVNVTLRDIGEKMADVLEKQGREIQKVREDLERLRAELLSKPRLTTQGRPEEIEGIEPQRKS